MADPLNLLTENKQQDPLGLLAKAPESQPVSDPLGSSADTDAIMPSWVDNAMKGVEAGFKMAPFKLGESLLGAFDTIDQYNPFGGGARQIARTLTEGVADIKLPKEIRPARDASLYLRDLANQQAPKIGEGTAGYYAQSAVSSILSNVPSIILGFATGSQFIGLLSMAVQVAEDKYNERILAGDSEEKARFGAGLYGAAEAIGEKIPLGILMKNKGIRAILLSSLTEIPTEIATTIMQNGIDIGIYDQDMSFSDWKKSIIDTAIITGIAAPFTAGLGRGLGVGAQKIMEKRQAGRVKPVIETQPITVPVEPLGEGNIEVKTEMKGQKVTASIDGKQVGSYDGEKMSISPQYEGNRYAIASALLEAHKATIESINPTQEESNIVTETVPAVKPEGGKSKENFIADYEHPLEGLSIKPKDIKIKRPGKLSDVERESFQDLYYRQGQLTLEEEKLYKNLENRDRERIPINEIINSPLLFEKYPFLKNKYISFSNNIEGMRSHEMGITIGKNSQFDKELFLHELTHVIRSNQGNTSLSVGRVDKFVKDIFDYSSEELSQYLNTPSELEARASKYILNGTYDKNKLASSIYEEIKKRESLPNPSRSPGVGEQKVTQSYEDFIAQIEQKEQLEKSIETALSEKDFDTLSKYVNNFGSARSFAEALGETYRKPSKFWKDEGYVSAVDFYNKNKLKRATQETLQTASYEGFISEETGELIGEDYKSADMATLENLLNKLERLRRGIVEETVQAKKKAYNFDFSLEKVKTVIRERTGQTRVDNLVKEMDALEFAYQTAQKASRDAYRQGDRAGALREHERMTLIQALKKARTDLNRETKTTFKYLDTVNKKLDGMRISDEYREAIRSALSYDGDGLETFALKQLENNDLVFIPEDMIEKLKETERDGITIDQLRNQKDIVKTLLYQARALNKIEVLNEKVNFNDTVNTIAQEIADAWHKDASTLLQRLTPSELAKQERLGYQGVSRFQEIKDRVTGLLSYVKKAEYIIERAVNGKRDSRLYQSTFDRTVAGERVEITNGKEIQDRVKEAVALIADNMKSIVQDNYEVPGLAKPITKQKAIMIALNSGHEQNRAALKAGYGLTDANIDAIVDSLNDKETEFVLKVWDTINSQTERLSETYKKLTGLPMKKIEGGQYFPLIYDRTVPQSTFVEEAQSKQDLFRTYSSVASVFRGFTKERVKQTKYPPLLDFSVIVRHLADVNHFIAWGVPVRDINRILTNPMVKEALIQSVGEEQYGQLRPWLKGIANDHFDTLKYADSLLGKLVNNSSVAILGYALSTTVLQPTAVLQAVNYKYEGADGKMRKIGVNEIIQGVIDFYKSYGENADIIYSLSPWMSIRTQQFDFNIRQAMEADNKHPFDERKFRNAAFATMGFMDKLASLPVWWTAYNIEMKESGDMQRAVNFADKVVRNTQGSGSAKDLAEMQRGGSVRRAFTMFQTFFNATYNEWGKTKDLVQGERVGSLEYAKTFMWICLLPAMLQALFRYREDVLEDPLEKVAKETTAYGFGSIPIFGSFVNALMGKYEFRPTPAVSLPTELIKLTYSKDVPAFLKHGVAATGYLTGIPSRQMLLTGEYIFDLLEGDETDPLNLIYKKPKK